MVNQWLAGIGDPELSWTDGPIVQNLFSPSHPMSRHTLTQISNGEKFVTVELEMAESLKEEAGQEKESPFDMGVSKEEDPLVHAYLCESGDCHVMCTQLKR